MTKFFKNRRKSTTALLAAVFLCALSGCVGRENPPPPPKNGGMLQTVITTVSTGDTAVTTAETTAPEEETSVPEETTAPEETPETTEETTAETEETRPEPVWIPETDGLRRIENFYFSDPESPEYRLAVLLTEKIPPVNKETVSTDENGEEITEITEMPGRVAVYYQDLYDGSAMAFAPDEVFYVASVTKITYIYALMQQIDAGEIDPDSELIYTADQYVEGSGSFQNVEDGTYFTVRALISKAVRQSDNTAFAMLQNRYRYAGFVKYMRESGVSPTSFNSWWRRSAQQYGKFFAVLYAYLTSDSENGAWLAAEMCRSTQTVMLKNALSPARVAHKYGWDVDSYCDGAIVLDEEHPYLLLFFSNLDEGSEKRANTEFIYELGGLVKQIHDDKYREQP